MLTTIKNNTNKTLELISEGKDIVRENSFYFTLHLLHPFLKEWDTKNYT